MPQIGNIVVKDASNVDKTFTAITGAAGDSPAIWRLNIIGYPPMLCPQFHAWQKQNRDGSVRRIEWKLVVPVVDVNEEKVEFKLLSSGVHYIPQGAATSGVADCAAFVGGILSNPAIVTSLKDGYLPT